MKNNTKQISQSNKNKKVLKVVIIVLIVALLIAGAIVAIVLTNDNKQSTPINTNETELSEKQSSKLELDENESCLQYVLELDSLDYATFSESEYKDLLYKYYETEDEEYYLVCQTSVQYVNTETESADLYTALNNQIINLEEVNTELESLNKTNLELIVKKDTSTVDDEENDSSNTETEDKQTSTSTNKDTSKSSSSSTKSNSSTSTNKSTSKNSSTSKSNSSSSSKSNNNSSNSSSGTTSTKSEKEKDNETLKKMLAEAGLTWDFNTKAEAEAFMAKWVARGFMAGYWINEYGESDTAYTGYVETGYGYCGLEKSLKVDYKSLPDNWDEIDYVVSLGYDCSGKCSSLSGKCY